MHVRIHVHGHPQNPDTNPLPDQLTCPGPGWHPDSGSQASCMPSAKCHVRCGKCPGESQFNVSALRDATGQMLRAPQVSVLTGPGGNESAAPFLPKTGTMFIVVNGISSWRALRVIAIEVDL
uniref:GG23768 n=1 Tax=Drosophila erecta TaxID=7220 RepID=B3NZ08_DROER